MGNKLSERDPNGNVTSFSYTPRYWLQTITDPAGATTAFGYDAAGNQTSVTDPNGNTTTNEYDDLNRLIKTTNPYGQAQTFGYDQAGNRTKQVDTNGHVTEWTYNPLKKLTQVKDAKGGITRYQYDPNGNLVSLTDAKNQTTRYEYNELNWLMKETNSLGLVSTYDYDLAGNRTYSLSPRGVQTSYSYYPNNLLQEVSYALGTEQEQISYEYDPAGNRTKMTDPSGSASYSYDPLNQVTKVQKSVLGRPYSTEYRYDKAGNITGIRYPGSSTWLEYRYNQTNRVYAMPGLADGSLSSPAFAYDPAGNLRSVRLNSGVTSTLIPDKLNRLASIEVSSPRLSNPVLSLAYTHDGEGNILTRNGNVYRYDELDRLIYAQVKGIFADDLPARQGYVTGDFVGDKALDYSTGDSTVVSFDYASSSVGLDFGSSAQVRRLFLTKDDPAADTSRLKPNTLDLYVSTDGATFTRLDPATCTLKATLDGFTFEFAEPQNLQQLKVHSKFDERAEDGAFTDRATFKNTLGELIKAEQELTQATLEYGYDAVGNRTYERFTKASIHSKDYVYYANSNRLLTDGHYAFVYDEDWNLIKKGNRFTLAGETVYFTTDGKGVEYWEYSYNLRNQLSQVRKNGQLVATYAYDGLGLRVSATTTITSKTTGQSKTTTRDYVFDLADRVIYDRVISTAGQLPASEDPETSTENSYVFANGVHFAKVEGAIGTSGEVYYYHNDHLGSPMAITDAQGNIAWSQDYLPYGEALNESATQTKTRFTFTGKELDPATGLMYYNARWYDQDLGRFTTEDTYAGDPNRPQTLNRYMYVVGNPLRYTDPTGHRMAVGSSMEDEDDTEEGQHVWTGNDSYDNTHAGANLGNERDEGGDDGNGHAPSPQAPPGPTIPSQPGTTPPMPTTPGSQGIPSDVVPQIPQIPQGIMVASLLGDLTYIGPMPPAQSLVPAPPNFGASSGYQPALGLVFVGEGNIVTAHPFTYGVTTDVKTYLWPDTTVCRLTITTHTSTLNPEWTIQVSTSVTTNTGQTLRGPVIQVQGGATRATQKVMVVPYEKGLPITVRTAFGVVENAAPEVLGVLGGLGNADVPLTFLPRH